MDNNYRKRTHSEWRKTAKKLRRKRLRQKYAQKRDEKETKRQKSPTYLTWLANKLLLDQAELEEEEKLRAERNEKWLRDEEEAQLRWREQQRMKALAQAERIQEQERIRKEWEREQKKIKEKKEEEKRLEEEENTRKMLILKRIDDFMISGGKVPEELQIVSETHRGEPVCPFFSKVGACRFRNRCSRNHRQPSLSKFLLFPNFYSHFTFDQSHTSEYDTDIGLEYEVSEMDQHFKEFYNDIVPELKAQGKVLQVKVCCNYEPHLRGNVYVEYKTEREALIAYKKFHGRWYGGKQLSVEFIQIPKWISAVCGDFSKNRCPKGKSCNFLHVFKNPKNEFPLHPVESNFESDKNISSHKDWRWSESPERSYKEDSLHNSQSRKRYSSDRVSKSSKENVNKQRRRDEKKRRKVSRSRSRSTERRKHRKSS